MQRKSIKIPLAEVQKLAEAGATQADMAGYFHVSLRTIVRRLAEPKYADVVTNGNAKLDISLRQKQIQLAMAGNVGMLIWLGKQRLGQREKIEHSGTGTGGSIELNVSAREQLASRIDGVTARIRESESLSKPN